MKYVVARNTVTEHYHVAVFSEFFVHDDVAKAIKKASKALVIVSAGYCHPDDNGNWSVTDERSATLGIGPRVREDAVLISLWAQGYEGLDLSNALAYLAIRKKGKV